MRQHKYFAKKVEVDGMKFDSMKEYKDWTKLCQLQEEGVIRDLQRQVKIEILPRQTTAEGKFLFHPMYYIADFVFVDKDGITHYQDSKGYRTDEYMMKRKLVYFRKGILIEEI